MIRYTDQELLALLDSLESDRIERKESFKGDVPKKARQAVCAFANDLPNYNQPGVLFIGAKDNGEPSGLEVTDQLLQALADIKTDGNILPLPVLTVELRHLKNADMAIISVMPSDMPPVKYDGRIWIRTGPRRALANETELSDYRNPNIGDVLKTFGYIQAFGRGIATARKELAKNANPELEFETNQSAVVCIIRGKS